jgi:putative DNA methylase
MEAEAPEPEVLDLPKPYQKKLIEVALPLEAINTACRADKASSRSIRNLHKTFAPMPSPALRAILYASFVNDPGEPRGRREVLAELERLVSGDPGQPPPASVDAARKRIRASLADEKGPTVIDPFCGGGSTLVEAQRLGLAAEGADISAVAVLVTKLLTEIPPQVEAQTAITEPALAGIPGFQADVRHYATWIHDRAQEELADLYPSAPNGDPVIAWWWARTVASPDPSVGGAQVPLVSSWQLSATRSNEAIVRPIVSSDRRAVSFEMTSGGTAPPPSKEQCVITGTPITFEYLRGEGAAGRLGMRLIAGISDGPHGRSYWIADEDHLSAAERARPLDPPETELPDNLGFRVQNYGVTRWDQLFTRRQLAMLETFARLVAAIPERVQSDGGDPDRSKWIAAVLGLCLGKLAQRSSTLVAWRTRRDAKSKAEPAFGRNDLPMTWDFAEVNPFAGSVGDWNRIVELSLNAFEYIEPRGPASAVFLEDARTFVASKSNAMCVTDPPYFDAIGYSGLYDFFYIWLRRALKASHEELFSTVLSRRDTELIADPGRHNKSRTAARQYFIDGFTDTFELVRSAADPAFPTVVVYAYRESGGQGATGWEAMLQAIVAAGLSITGTWPIHGTGRTRLRGQGSNALATYVVLVCRPRSQDAAVVGVADFIRALRSEIPMAVRVLQAATIAPVDLAQAVIGPGMRVYTSYREVLDADGKSVAVGTALSHINRVLGETLDQQEADFDAPTRWAVAWYAENGFGAGDFGRADHLARAKVTSVDALRHSGIVGAEAGRVWLVGRDALASYDPMADSTPTVWEATQWLAWELSRHGELAAAEALQRLSVDREAVRELAYLLFSIADRSGSADEAVAYNSLVLAWPELEAISSREGSDSGQQALGV